MDHITLADIGTWLGFLAALIGSCGAIYAMLRKLLKKLFASQTKDIQARLDRIDMEATKNYLVSVLSDAESGIEIGEIQRMRIREQFDHYQNIGGNSYVKDWYCRLKKENKI